MNVVKDEVIYIDEKSYQQLKEKLCKKDDYFYIDEIKEYSLEWEYFST